MEQEKKSTFIAYLCWFIGCFFGLHQFYLGRDRHALVLFTSYGGVFGLACLRDFFKIPQYVAEVNESEEYLEEITHQMRKHQKPPFSLSRFGGELFLALVWGHWWNAAVPRDPIFGIDISFLRLLAPVFVAAAVHTVGNIGNQQGSFMKPLISSYLLYTLNGFHDRAITSAALSATIGFNWRAKEWRRVKEPKGSLRKRLLKTAVVVVFSYGLVVSFLYFNCEVRDNSGVSTKCRDALQNFLNSPAWVDMKTQLLRIYEVIKLHGWSRVYEEIINSIDPLGEKKALEILELSQGASQENITAQYRSLSRKYHPDRYKDPEEKIKAQEKFIEIQQAYERLSDIKTKRKRANKKPSDQGTTNEFSQGPDDVNNDDDEDFIHDRDL